MAENAMPLGEEEVLRLYAWRAHDRFLFIASSGDTTDLVKEQPISSQSLQRIKEAYQKLAHIARTRKSSHTPFAHYESSVFDACSDLGRLLRRLLLHPDIRGLLESAKYGEISISTNEFGIPWELVGAGSSFLGLLHPVTRRLQTGRAQGRRNLLARRNRLRILLAHNPTEDLPGADFEADEIQRILGDDRGRYEIDSIRGRDIERFALLEAISSHDVFHYAGHAHFDARRPKESSLLLFDGPLLASELSNYLSDSPPLLVFLNACESSRFADAESVIIGAELASLADAFISTGVNAVIGSSLPVGDEQAAKFSSIFYKCLSEGETVAMSVHSARQAVVAEFGVEDPTWASFLFFGSGRLRIHIDPSLRPPTASEVHEAIKEAAGWLMQERAENGRWCDRVYRTEAPTNIAEAIEALSIAKIAIPTDILTKSMESLIGSAMREVDASPYEPKGLGSFASAVAHVLSGLLAGVGLITGKEDHEEAANALDELCSRLLAMQCSDGGWSWGSPAENIPSYCLFTTEAIGSLHGYCSWHGCAPSKRTRIMEAIARGRRFLESAQQMDGGWGVHSDATKADPANTCYALAALALCSESVSDQVVTRACQFLQQEIDLANLQEEQFFVDHRIVVPDRAPSSWPHFEDYSGLGGLLEALLLCKGLEDRLGDPTLTGRVARKLLQAREPGRGWPARYSTIYVTAYYVRVLAHFGSLLSK